MDATIRFAEFPKDRDAVVALFGAYVHYLFVRVPDIREGIARKYPPHKIDEAVDTFAKLHARPGGAILLAEMGDVPVGVGMMRRQAPGAAELQRIFVRDAARGTGIGRALTEALIDVARQDGHRYVRLDTGRTLTEVIAFYEALGFAEVPPYHDETPWLTPSLIFMERAL